jgi:hypothetical protein
MQDVGGAVQHAVCQQRPNPARQEVFTRQRQQLHQASARLEGSDFPLRIAAGRSRSFRTAATSRSGKARADLQVGLAGGKGAIRTNLAVRGAAKHKPAAVGRGNCARFGGKRRAAFGQAPGCRWPLDSSSESLVLFVAGLPMANKVRQVAQQRTGGKFYVDQQCIDCDLCRETAPSFFTRNDEGGYSFVQQAAGLGRGGRAVHGGPRGLPRRGDRQRRRRLSARGQARPSSLLTPALAGVLLCPTDLLSTVAYFSVHVPRRSSSQ